MTDDELRQAFQDPRGAEAEGCDLDAIWSGAMGELDEAALLPLLAHVRSCGACAEAWALARAAGEGARADAEEAKVEVPPAANRSLAWVALLAAAVMVAVGLFALQRPVPADVEPPVFRGDGDGVKAGVGKGDVAAQRRLWWSPVSGAARYEVTVLSPRLDVLHEARTEVPEVVVPPSVPAGPVLWRVTARRADGTAVESDTFEAVLPEVSR
jgi:hypothetical protein